MLRTLFLLLALLFIGTPVVAGDFLVLCYHGVEDQVKDDPDAMTVTTDNLVSQLNWFKEHGWTALSLADLQAIRSGRKNLPEKAYLLTFDDGYANVYSRVFPILKAHKVPAVIALVTSWMETPSEQLVNYGTQKIPRDYFMSWDQLREMVDSGLVEVASHSHNLHRGVLGNPQGNELPATTTRLWLAEAQRYETEAEWRARIHADLKMSVDIISRRLGRPPAAMVWPYGQYNWPAVEIASELGMELTLTLDSEKSSLDRLRAIPRLLIQRDPRPDQLVWQVQHRHDRKIRRVVHIDLDYVYDADPQQQYKNLSQLLDRIKALQVNTVFLQAYSDPDGNGAADSFYFPNRHLPMRADLFNRVAWQLRTRAGVEVFAWMPMLAFSVDGAEKVQRINPKNGRLEVDPAAHQRLSPFVAENRQLISEIYEDLAAHADFAGLLFSDDGWLSDYEDAGPAALQHYQQAWDLPAEVSQIRQAPMLATAWSRHKTAELIRFSGELFQAASKWRPQLKSARNIYALPILKPYSESWFANEMQAFLESYDWVAVMAMPWMEGAEDPQRWLRELINQIKRYPGALDKTIFELQTVDWSQENRKIPTHVIAQQMNLLLEKGVVNFGYYPDNFLQNHPNADILYPALSLGTYPYARR